MALRDLHRRRCIAADCTTPAIKATSHDSSVTEDRAELVGSEILWCSLGFSVRRTAPPHLVAVMRMASHSKPGLAFRHLWYTHSTAVPFSHRVIHMRLRKPPNCISRSCSSPSSILRLLPSECAVDTSAPPSHDPITAYRGRAADGVCPSLSPLAHVESALSVSSSPARGRPVRSNYRSWCSVPENTCVRQSTSRRVAPAWPPLSPRINTYEPQQMVLPWGSPDLVKQRNFARSNDFASLAALRRGTQEPR